MREKERKKSLYVYFISKYINHRSNIFLLYASSYTGWKNAQGESDTLDMLRREVGNLAVPAVYYRAGYGPRFSPDAYYEIWLEARE